MRVVVTQTCGAARRTTVIATGLIMPPPSPCTTRKAISHKGTDLEADLVAFAQAWTEPVKRYRDHFAGLRQLRAEVGHIPQDFLDAWRNWGAVSRLWRAGGRGGL
ncbi:hypothetical protein ABT009_16760 [Streptomyces sp. NPDC002896]|uniref:hypothetical protein n=1 Tax=Streptomyces sp. NPDC002896 TaxID=3154438 RepID=UPI003316F0F6